MEPAVILQALPEGYRIIVDDQDGCFYPQRHGCRFASRTEFGGGSFLDRPRGFRQEQDARALIEADSQHPRPASWGSIVYREEELPRAGACAAERSN